MQRFVVFLGSLLLPGVVATQDDHVSVVFTNRGGRKAGISWVPATPSSFREVSVSSDDHWHAIAEAIGGHDLRLQHDLPSFERGGNVGSLDQGTSGTESTAKMQKADSKQLKRGAKLLKVGSLDRGINGTECIAKLLRQAHPEQPYPVRVSFRVDEPQKNYLGIAHGNGGSLSQDSFVGHHFELSVEGVEPRDVVVKSTGTIFFEAQELAIRVWGDGLDYRPKINNYKGPKWQALTAEIHEQCAATFEGHPADAAHFCDPRYDNRVFVEAKFDHSDQERDRVMKGKQASRIRDTATQPKAFRNFTEVGFKDLDFDPAIYAKLKAFHKSHRLTARPESMPWDDPNLSGRDSETWMADLPQELKREMFHEVRRVLSEWASVPEADLKEAALFGIRLYHKGSVLNMHVDRKDTHVLSSIVVVGRADEDDTEDWPLHILDHSGKEVTIPARPGQLILYESATCAHGRPDVFAGREMGNAFVHFTPAGWPEKYEVNRNRGGFLHEL